MAKTKTKNPNLETGTISVNTEDIFPIIKRSLYSEQEIFLRELISNAIDATKKLKYLAGRGEYDEELGDLEITISLDKEAKTLTVSDVGIGMSGEEVKKYINQVAFSGAEEFVKKFKEADQGEDIIGKFGLGFYSAFMVSKQVEVVTKSYRKEDEAVRWTCDGTTSYSMEPTTREKRGTDIILHINEEDEGYLEESRIKTILDKYCRFLPIPIKFNGEQVNNTHPIWRKAPTDLKDEDYQEFFKELYPFAEDPLFWIHLNVDYPFNLTGILYFPRIKKNIDPQKNQISLYSRQVFITDEVKDIVPEYLMLLKGVIDSPDIPLNVSRSYLQGDVNVKKISNYITKKVAEKLDELYKEDAEKFEEKWDDISVFVKYGMLTDDKFYERAEKFCLVQNVEGKSFPLSTYREKVAPLQTDKNEEVIFLYTNDKHAQDMFVDGAMSKGYDVLEMDGVIDTHFIGLMERKQEKTRWVRVDSDTVDKLIQKDEEAPADDGIILTEEQTNAIKETFEKARPNAQIMIQTDKLGSDAMPVVVTRNEFMRRMREQAAMSGGMGMMMGDMPETVNAVVNTQHPLVQQMADQKGGEALAKQLLDLALLSQNMLTGKDLTGFIKRSIDMIGKEGGAPTAAGTAAGTAKKPAAKKPAAKKPSAASTAKKPTAKKSAPKKAATKKKEE